MYVTVKGTVVFIEEKSIKGKAGEADTKYRVVTLMGGKPGGKPELDAVKVLNGLKVELGAKMELPIEVGAYLKHDRDGKVSGAGLSAKAVE